MSKKSPVILTIKNLRGVVARWAVSQSPYPQGPDGLPEVLLEITRRFDKQATRECLNSKFIELAPDRKAVQSYLQELLFDIPQVKAWNERKNGRQGIGIVTATGSDASGPNDDFIDLYALVQNIATTLLNERLE